MHLYLNGLYWGLYSPTERPNALWAANYQGGNAEDYDVINTGGNVVDGTSNAWNDLSRSWHLRDSTTSRSRSWWI